MDSNALQEEERKIRGDLVSQQKEQEFMRSKRKQETNQIQGYGEMDYIFSKQQQNQQKKRHKSRTNKEDTILSEKSRSRGDIQKMLKLEEPQKHVKGFDWTKNDNKSKSNPKK